MSLNNSIITQSIGIPYQQYVTSSAGHTLISSSTYFNDTSDNLPRYKDANGLIYEPFITSSYAITASHALNASTPTLQEVVTAGASATGDVSITGSLIVSGSFNAFRVATTNLVLGTEAGENLNPSATGNVILGNQAGMEGSSTTQKNVFIGDSAGEDITGTSRHNVFLGLDSGKQGSGKNDNIGIGLSALKGRSTADSSDGNVAIGYSAAQQSLSTRYTVAIGYNAVAGNASSGFSGYGNIGIGRDAISNLGTSGGAYNTAIGYYAGYGIQSGDANIVIGSGSLGFAAMSNQLRIGHADVIAISGSLSTGDVIFYNTASAPNFSGSFQGDGSQLTGITATAGSTAGRVVFTTTSGELTTESGFDYNSSTNQLTVESLNVTHLTSSFITSSRIHTSGSNIFGDDTTDTQTLIGTTKMTGSAQVTGSFKVQGASGNVLNIGNDGSFTLGQGASGTNNNPDTSVVIGKNATVTSDDSVVIGDGATTNTGGQKNVVIGHGASVIGNTSFGVVVGENAYVNGTNGIALGRSSTADGDGIAIGRDSNVSGDRGIAIGKGATAGEDQLLIGHSSTYEPIISASLETGHIILSQTSSDGYSQGGLEVHGSGSNVFEVIGSEGTLFTIDDDLDGVIFTANNRTGNPVLQASASGEVYIGSTPQSLYTTAVISSTAAATTQSIFGLSTSSYGGAFFDYTVQSGSNARAGSIMSVWNGSNISFTETTTTDIGDTTDFNVIVHISQSQAQIASHATRAGYNIKTIIRSI